ncbi:MAG: PASTA domain-containing protein [Pseudonocardiaceae bacterium]
MKLDHDSGVSVHIVSSGSSPTPPPVPVIPLPPRPVPVIPLPPRPVPVVPSPSPRPVPVFRRPVPVFRRPVPVVPRPVPVFRRPVPVVPRPVPVRPLSEVPNVVGYNLATAEQLLVQNGLTVGSVIEQNSSQPAGTVVQTTPTAYSVVLPGSVVELVVAG